MSNQQLAPEQKTLTPPPITPQEAQDLCNNLFSATSELIALLEQETSLLRNSKTKEIPPLSVRKDALTATLAHHMEKFKAHSSTVRKFAPAELKSLEGQREQFRKSIESNQAALIAMQAVTERILQTVADKVAVKQGGPSVYTPGGQVTQAGTKRSAAINVDTAL